MLGDWPGRFGAAFTLLACAGLLLAACGGEPRIIEPEPPPPAETEPVPAANETDPGENEALSLPRPGPGETLHPLTGYPVDMVLLERRPFLVSVDNHPRARPQYGLSRADLVYEVPVEGGVTRFAALFWAHEAEQIGPVRSSRPYFLDLAVEWQAAFLHAGGSPQHYEQIDRLAIPDIDDIRGAAGGGVFWRGDDRNPPHNLYTGSQQVREKIAQRDWDLTPARRDLWRYALPADLPAADAAEGIEVRWPATGGAPERFVYDETSGLYARYVGDEIQIDGLNDEALRMRNLIIQLVDTRVIPGDTEGRLEVNVIGSGRAMVASSGTVREARWRKVDRPSPTVFTEAGGEPLTLVPGPTWILVVPVTAEITPVRGGAEASPSE
ncbi:MAG TPA: DUF3048 domain-containing protein [Bacillota bacterium]